MQRALSAWTSARSSWVHVAASDHVFLALVLIGPHGAFHAKTYLVLSSIDRHLIEQISNSSDNGSATSSFAST